MVCPAFAQADQNADEHETSSLVSSPFAEASAPVGGLDSAKITLVPNSTAKVTLSAVTATSESVGTHIKMHRKTADGKVTTLAEGSYEVDGKRAYCIDCRSVFSGGTVTRKALTNYLSQDEITKCALMQYYCVKVYKKGDTSLPTVSRVRVAQTLMWNLLDATRGPVPGGATDPAGRYYTVDGTDEGGNAPGLTSAMRDEMMAGAKKYAKDNLDQYIGSGYAWKNGDTQMIATFSLDKLEGYMTMVKTATEKATPLIKGNGTYDMTGIKYKVYTDKDDEGNPIKPAKTLDGDTAVFTCSKYDKDTCTGTFNTLKMALGDYFIQEVESSVEGTGFQYNDTVYRIVVDEDNDTKAEAAKKTVTDYSVSGYLTMTKKSTDTSIIGVSGYDMTGIKYNVYTDKECSKRATNWDGEKATLTCTSYDANTATAQFDIVRMPLDTYYLKEVASSVSGTGFEANDTVLTVKVTQSNTTKATAATTEASDAPVPVPPVIYIKTTATDSQTGEHYGQIDGDTVTLIDRVEYSGLTAGTTYTMTGTLVDQEASTPDNIVYIVDADNNPISAKVEFVAESTQPAYVDVSFIVPVDSVRGKTTVVFEQVSTTSGPVAEHADIDDEDQTVVYPDVRTTATDKDTGEHEGAAVGETVTIIDVVECFGLIPGNSYQLVGTIMDKSTNEPLKCEKGNEFTASTEFIAESSYEKHELEFTIPRECVEGHTTVVFEDLYYNDKKIAFHNDINDEGQTVDYPKIRTTATDAATGGHEGLASGTITLIDEVRYENLLAGNTYTVNGTLMDKATGEPLLGLDGQQIISSASFVAGETEEPGTRISGSVDVTFVFDASVVEGKTTVVFEDLYPGPEVSVESGIIAEHKDINDEGQTVSYPKLRTTATINGTHMYEGIDEQITLVDNVVYEGLTPGKEYTLTGTIWTKRSENGADDAQVANLKTMFGEQAQKQVDAAPLAGSNGQAITSTITFTPQTANGSVDLPFTLNLRDLANYNRIDKDGRLGLTIGADGTTMTNGDTIFNGNTVVFEDLYTQVPKDGAVASELVGQHADINDEGQTVGMKIPNFKLTKTGEEPFAALPFISIAGAALVIAGGFTLLRRRANK